MNKKEVIEFIGEGNSIIDFYADWCGPCKMIMPVLEEISEEKDIKLIKINVDECGSELLDEYDITSIPRIIVIKEGKKVGDFVGMIQSKEEITNLLD